MVQAKLDVSDQLGPRTVQIEKDPFAIGRRVTSDLHLTSGEVSRDHAEIVRAGDGFEIRDRDSRYGTFVNGEEVKAHRLEDGDQVKLGRSGGAELVFLLSDAPVDDGRSASAVGEMHQVAVLLEGLRALSSGRVLDGVLALVIDSAIAVSGAERGFIMLVGEENELEFKLGRSRDRVTLPGISFKISRKIPEEVFRTGQARIEADLLEGDLATKHEGTVALGIRNVLCMPLRLVRYVESVESTVDDKRVGVLYLDSREKGKLMSSGTRATLETLAAEATVAIDNAQLYNTALEKARLDQEMATAAQIQQALLPTPSRSGGFFDAAGEMLACRSIGGDFFEYMDLPDGGFGFALGDVSGKGPPAALLGALLQGTLQAQATLASGPAVALGNVNAALIQRAIEARFVTLFYAVLNPDGQLNFCNAGHNPPFLVGRNGVRRLETGGIPLGLFAGTPLEEETVTMEPGDFVVTFSDGVSEAFNPAGEEFEDSRILDSIEQAPGRDVQTQLEHLFSSVKTFTAGAAQNDDVTVLVVSYGGPLSE
jgi:sigma-B regulation protein RsbU (phosphoserine phosphatase)